MVTASASISFNGTLKASQLAEVLGMQQNITNRVLNRDRRKNLQDDLKRLDFAL
jgi:hypothetical protein